METGADPQINLIQSLNLNYLRSLASPHPNIDCFQKKSYFQFIKEKPPSINHFRTISDPFDFIK